MRSDVELLNSPPVVYETHMHTPLCRHAMGEPEEYASAAQQRGLKGIIVTCHNPLPSGYAQDGRMDQEEFPTYLDMVARAQMIWQDRVDVRLGLECDFVPGMERFLELQTTSAPFDYLLGSIHPHLSEYLAIHGHQNPLSFHRIYFEHLALAAESRLFDCLTHPDIVKNVCPNHWRLSRIMPDICRALDRIARTGVAMELNTSGLLKEIAEMNPGRAILREMHARDIPVVVGGDAHHPSYVANQYEAAYDLLKDVGYQHVSIFLGRYQHDIPIEEARRSLIPVEVTTP